MKNFQYAAARDARRITLLSDDWDAARVAGGTDLLDEMKERLVSPTASCICRARRLPTSSSRLRSKPGR